MSKLLFIIFNLPNFRILFHELHDLLSHFNSSLSKMVPKLLESYSISLSLARGWGAYLDHFLPSSVSKVCPSISKIDVPKLNIAIFLTTLYLSGMCLRESGLQCSKYANHLLWYDRIIVGHNNKCRTCTLQILWQYKSLIHYQHYLPN